MAVKVSTLMSLSQLIRFTPQLAMVQLGKWRSTTVSSCVQATPCNSATL